MRISYVINARLPNKKAYGIQAAKTCEALIEAGVGLTLIMPSTRASVGNLKDFYQLRTDIPAVTLPGLDWYDRGRFGFLASSLVFMLMSFGYLLYQRMRGKIDAIYTIDMDAFSLGLLPLTGIPCFAEIHLVKSDTFASRLFFKRARGIISLNTHVRDSLAATFKIPLDRFIVEPCGVEEEWFTKGISRTNARAKLGIPLERKVAAYIGRFYDWKGLDILPRAFALVPDIHCYIVGGTEEQFEKATGSMELTENVHVAGECASYDVPLWHAAADVLLVPWPKNQAEHYQNASPMKIFEYMAAKRPVVGAYDPALTSVIASGNARFYEPGNPEDMARKVAEVLRGGSEIETMIERAHAAAHEYALPARTARSKAFIERLL